jgi:hypothetical protein
MVDGGGSSSSNVGSYK